MQLKIADKYIKINLLNTETSEIIQKSKNFVSRISTWGDEIYFKTPIKGVKLEENTSDIMKFGEIAYWVEGCSVAIGFGPTPASVKDEIRLVSKVNIWANFDINNWDVNFFKQIKDGDIVEFIN
ncbi:MAG: hypothetical protein MRY23_04280 [Pelagibacteraceae bacterium]|nr:hypothetical protein [Pelagibacteraceae bacterium]MCI5079202.1 hypothetical protein [Pelagibacteraceae bacterium]